MVWLLNVFLLLLLLCLYSNQKATLDIFYIYVYIIYSNINRVKYIEYFFIIQRETEEIKQRTEMKCAFIHTCVVYCSLSYSITTIHRQRQPNKQNTNHNNKIQQFFDRTFLRNERRNNHT